MKLLAIVIFTCLLSINAYSQTYSLPKIIPPSPQASQMAYFNEFPMNLSTGLPNVEIPIYTIALKELSIPISIGYLYSGLKPNEAESGTIGLGWVLNCFGIISRNIRNVPDENYWNTITPQRSNLSSTTNSNQQDPDASFLANLTNGYPDTDPDIFNYNLPGGGSGKFVLQKSTSLSEFLTSPLTLPYKPLKISSFSGGGNMLDYFEIKDEKGVFYRFGKSLNDGTYEKELYFNAENSIQGGVSSWLLTEIITADRSDTVHFEYGPVEFSTGISFKTKYHKGFTQTVSRSISSAVTYSQNTIYNGYTYSQKKIKKIKFRNGSVEFTYKTNVYPNNLLEKINVYSNSTLLQTVKLTQSTFHNIATMLNWQKLDKAEFYDSDAQKINEFKFFYDNTQMPGISDNFTKESYAIDFNGYYNGVPNSNTLPNFQWNSQYFNGYSIFGFANRSCNYLYAKAGVLTSLVNQTGGETTFEYESNTGSLDVPVSGIRAKKITYKTGSSQIVKTYSYSGSSELIEDAYFQNYSLNHFWPYSYEGPEELVDIYTGSSEPNYDFTSNGHPVLYSKVTEYLGEGANNTGRVEHFFDNSSIPTRIMNIWGISRGYPWNRLFEFRQPYPMFYKNIIPGSIFENETQYFNSSGDIIKKDKRNYSHSLKQRINGFYVKRCVSSNLAEKLYFFDCYNYNVDQIDQRLESTVTTDYMAGAEMVNTVEYSYNSSSLMTEMKSSTSRGIQKRILYKYPFDFYGSAPYTQMVENNIISPVIEQQSFLGSSTIPIEATKTNYNFWGNSTWGTYSSNSIIVPQSVDVKIGLQSSYEPRVRYHAYDTRGNILSVAKEDDIRHSYIYDYNLSYPIAEVKNGASDRIAATSFEADGKGNWSFSGTSVSATAGTFVPTGTKYYALNSGAISANVTSGSSYIISYWRDVTTNSPYAVSGGTGTVSMGRSVSGWTYFEHKVTATSGTVTISGSGNIDEVRLYPVGAEMTTYTYKPLTGMSTMTDVNGKTTYYDYDKFNRLETIRDQDGNIIKKIQYHYNGQ